MQYPSRRSFKLIGAVLGIMATGVPMFLFNSWLKKQGEEESAIGTEVFQTRDAVAVEQIFVH